MANKKANIIVGAVIAAIVLAACAAGTLFAKGGESGYEAIAHDENGAEHVIDLEHDQELAFETESGFNKVRVESGEVSIFEADCPNGDCLRQHAISKPGEQLICLPHRFWVEIVPKGSEGGEMDVDAARSDDDVDFVSR